MSIICKTNPNLNPMPIDLNSTHGYLTFDRKFRRSFGCRGGLSPSWGSYCWWTGLGWLPEWPSHHPWSSGHPSPSWGSYWLGWLLGWSVAVVGVLLLVDRRLRWLLGWPLDHPWLSGPTRRGGPTAGRTPTGRVPHTAHHREHVTFEQGTNLGSLAPQSELN